MTLTHLVAFGLLSGASPYANRLVGAGYSLPAGALARWDLGDEDSPQWSVGGGLPRWASDASDVPPRWSLPGIKAPLGWEVLDG